MGWRTVVVTGVSKLDYKMGYLTVRSNDEVKRVHLSEIDTLLIESTAVSLTAYLLVELANEKINVIFCDEKRQPHGTYLPYAGSHDSSQKIRAQAKWSDEKKRLVWQYIVLHKIEGQAAILHFMNKLEEEKKLLSYLTDVTMGDDTNREGHAAKVYFNALFGQDFTREDDDNLINCLLNYGYSILLSTVSREIVNNGYITQLGINHNNIFNELNLACDLMEPFRPFVDYKVLNMLPSTKVFGKDEKHELVRLMEAKIKIDFREQYFPNAISIYCKSILNAIDEGNPSIIKFPMYELSIYESNSDV